MREEDSAKIEALVALGEAAYQSERHAEAIEHLRSALRLGGLGDDGLYTLGAALQANGEIEPAKRCFSILAERRPHDPAPKMALGMLAWNQGNVGEALAHLWLAKCRGGESTELLSCFADALLILGRVNAAREVLARAVQLSPTSEEFRLRLAAIETPDDPIVAKRELGLALLSAGLADDAEGLLEQTLVEAPNDLETLLALGGLYRDTERGEDAVAVYRRAVARYPDDSVLHAGLGAALAMTGKFADAHIALEEAIRLDPINMDALRHQAKCHLEEGRPDEAMAASDRALAASPGNPEATFARAVVRLLNGSYDDGWADYEARRQLPGKPFPAPAIAEWHGEPLRGKTLHVVTEQGAGDTVMFASCLRELEKLDGPVALHCEPRLVPIMARSFPGFAVVPEMPEPTAEDLWVPLGSLPGMSRHCDEDFASGAEYMRADQNAIARWRAQYQTHGDGLKVGIAWRGGKGCVERRKRTIALSSWVPVLSTPGISFVDLQYGEHAVERAALVERIGPVLYRPEGSDPVADLDDFAARVAALDLVISVDNTTVHFAGALGTPVWTLVPTAPSWRWQLGRLDTPWYPSMRLIRQDKSESWAAVLQRVATELQEFCEHRTAAPNTTKSANARLSDDIETDQSTRTFPRNQA